MATAAAANGSKANSKEIMNNSTGEMLGTGEEREACSLASEYELLNNYLCE